MTWTAERKTGGRRKNAKTFRATTVWHKLSVDVAQGVATTAACAVQVEVSFD